ncbi:PTS transporter subunit IIC [Tessaracoccus sp.]|uniref:PTS transporter subunit IIC n=1 Tax=Tessaracoccus sp. TaxID=1971211 RepID=UPI0026191A5F|nr:PTS transporter subunit IIC [Tessaracoccus sp.]
MTAVNIIMLLVRATRVVNVDIWNIWHMAFTGAIVQVATGSFWWASSASRSSSAPCSASPVVDTRKWTGPAAKALADEVARLLRLYQV